MVRINLAKPCERPRRRFYPRLPSLRFQSRALTACESLEIRPRRDFVYGYQVGSRLPPKRVTTIDSGRVYFLIPYSPWRKPIPDSFQPPIGTSVARKLEITSLTLTAPASILRATRSARLFSPKTEAASPYLVSLASFKASSESRTFITQTTGPKVSSRITFIEWSTSTSTVGSK